MGVDTEILVVNTNTDELDWVVGVLRSVGYHTTSTPSFEAARELIKGRRYDLLLTALRLPPYNGLHLVIYNQVVHSTAKALVMVSPADLGSEVDARRLGAQVVEAPVQQDRLLAAVRSILDGRVVSRERRTFAVRASKG